MSQAIKEKVHAEQQKFLSSDARFRCIAAGRRGGKTHACVLDARDNLIDRGNGEYLIWWVAPTYSQAQIAFRKLLKIFPDDLIDDISRQSKIVKTPFGRIEFKSADRPDNLRGEGVDELIIDEAAQVGEYAWENALRPTLSDSKSSRMVAISTPKGRNWFHRLYLRGQDPDEDEYESWQFPTTENPFISQEDVQEARRSLPDRVFRQEYLAEFVDDAGGVFRGIRDKIEDYDWREYDGHGPYSIGVDFARHEDWTVIVALDRDNILCDFARMQDVAWTQIQAAVERIDQKYNNTVVHLDATRDNKIVSDLERSGIDVDPVKFSPQNKREMIEDLVTAFEQDDITIPDIPPLVNELEIFEYETTPAGNVRYQAPEGFHDDCVDALAMAAKNTRELSLGAAFG